jgi:uncharacterized protein YgiB involved in biofilm formation
MKRSRRASLVLMSATPFLMLACEKDEPALIYRTAEECKRVGLLTSAECDSQFAWASDESERIAPRYSLRDDCEGDFGAYGCRPHGSHYIPLMAGVLARRVAAGAANALPLSNPQPLYESMNDRGMLRTAGNQEVSRLTGPVHVASALLRPTQAARVVSRGGFGRGASFHGGSSYHGGFHGGGFPSGG